MFLYAFIASLWAADLDYANVDKGDPAPFTGKLLTHDAIAQIIATHEKELLQADLDKEFELQRTADNLNLKYDLYSTKCEADKEMYIQMIEARDVELKAQARRDWIQRLAFFGGFALGTATTIGITYSVNQN
jgi:hypothetical protein|tara:strand:+ start:5788 stop:6183 length:396 start_codon:yes stop_codon:yes gene_type:complete